MSVAAPRLPSPTRWLVVAARVSLALVALAALLLTATPAKATTGDGSHPAELQPAPEDGQEQFGEPSDERTEQVTRLLRNVLGGIVAVVVLLLVIVLPLKLRNRGSGESDAPPGGTTDA